MDLNDTSTSGIINLPGLEPPPESRAFGDQMAYGEVNMLASPGLSDHLLIHKAPRSKEIKKIKSRF